MTQSQGELHQHPCDEHADQVMSVTSRRSAQLLPCAGCEQWRRQPGSSRSDNPCARNPCEQLLAHRMPQLSHANHRNRNDFQSHCWESAEPGQTHRAHRSRDSQHSHVDVRNFMMQVCFSHS